MKRAIQQTNPRPVQEPGPGAYVDYLAGGYHLKQDPEPVDPDPEPEPTP